jgi:ribonuclease P/MRP protein subunit POP1
MVPFWVQEMDKTLKTAERAAKNKKSRRVRRHARSLLSGPQRRARSAIWLETHIWHAKRFHMINAFGYR